MNNTRIEELIKGNQTLTEKVDIQQRALDEKDEIIKRLTVENYKLRNNLSIINNRLDQLLYRIDHPSIGDSISSMLNSLSSNGFDTSDVAKILKENDKHEEEN